jgi:hypothetical protein
LVNAKIHLLPLFHPFTLGRHGELENIQDIMAPFFSTIFRFPHRDPLNGIICRKLEIVAARYQLVATAQKQSVGL